MNTWYEIKVKYARINEQGKESKVNETYLLDALSFTEAEARANEQFTQFIHNAFLITNIKIAKYAEIVNNTEGDRFFKCKVSMLMLDEEKGTEKKANSNTLILAYDVKDAYEKLKESMKGFVGDFEIPVISESPILDVFPYFSDSAETNIPANLTPVGEVVDTETETEVEEEVE